MKSLLAWSLVCCVMLVTAYSDVDESFSFDDLTKNRTALKIYLDCFASKGPCDNTALHYKNHIRDAVWNKCQYCSSHHKHSAHVFLTAVEKEFPEETKELKKMYDKQGSHFQVMEDLVNKY